MRLLAPLSLTILCGCSTHTQPLDNPSYSEQISLTTPVQQVLPGPDGLPTTLFIDSTTLALSTQAIYHNYYCAPEGSAHAHHVNQGSITSKGDCIGIRIDKKSGKKEWVINNGNFSNRASLWVKEIHE